MRRSRFTDKDVLDAVTDITNGVPVRDVGIRLGVSESTVYSWRSKYRGLKVEGIARARELEQENARLRMKVESQALHIGVLKAEIGRFFKAVATGEFGSGRNGRTDSVTTRDNAEDNRGELRA